MKNLWKNRSNNLEKTASIGDNFGFILFNSKIQLLEEKTSEFEFRQQISGLKETENPQIGDIAVWMNDNIIKYSGILIRKNQFLSKEYGMPTIKSQKQISEEYGQYREEFLSPLQIKYYSIK